MYFKGLGYKFVLMKISMMIIDEYFSFLHSFNINARGLNIHIRKHMLCKIGTQNVMWVPGEAQLKKNSALQF